MVHAIALVVHAIFNDICACGIEVTKDQIIVWHSLAGHDQPSAVQSLLSDLLVGDNIHDVAEKAVDVTGGLLQDSR
jgi:hypothetical protein